MSADVRTTDLCDEFPEHVSVCEPIFGSYGAKRSFHGPVSTVRVFEDNVLVLEALEEVPSGTVLVVDGGASKRCALLGDRLAAIAAGRGLAGIVVNGCVRDSGELAEIDVGILALATHPRKSRKDGAGARDVPVSFGGVMWRPGHHAYADGDGLVVAPGALDNNL